MTRSDPSEPDNCVACGTPTTERVDGRPACEECAAVVRPHVADSSTPEVRADGGTAPESDRSGPTQPTLSELTATLAPIRTGHTSAECPVCSRRIGESRRPRAVDSERFRDPALRAGNAARVPVWSFECDDCQLLLVVDPAAVSDSGAAPDDPGKWMTVELETDRGTRLPCLAVAPATPGGFDGGGEA